MHERRGAERVPSPRLKMERGQVGLHLYKVQKFSKVSHLWDKDQCIIKHFNEYYATCRVEIGDIKI